MADAVDNMSISDLALGIDVFFMLVNTILILMMQAGFALYEVGTIRRTPVEVILLKNIMDASIAYASWYVLGSTLAGDGNRFIGGTGVGPFLTGDEYNGDGAPLAFMRFLFYAMFAGTAVTVMSGSVADRVPYLLYAIYAVWTCAFTYPVVEHWVWSPDGWMSPVVGAIGNCGALDFAGSGVVHAFAGSASFVWAYMLPDRPKRFVRNPNTGKVNSVNFGDGFNVQDRTQQALGVFLLWLGWYGFNCGSALSITSRNSSQIVSIVAVNTTLAPVVCCLMSIAIEWAYSKNWFHAREWFVMWSEDPRVRGGADREQKDLHAAAINGILSGLVSITAGCATTDPGLTVVIAVVAAFVYHYSFRLQLSRGLDDAVNAVPVHLYCGIWGLFSAALMFSPSRHDILMSAYGVDESRGRCGRESQVAANVVFALALVVWSGATSLALYCTLKLVFPEELKPLPANRQPELSTFAQIVDAVQSHLTGSQTAPNRSTNGPAATAAVGAAS